MRMDHEPTVDVRLTCSYDASAGEVFDEWLDPWNRGECLHPAAFGQIVRTDIDVRVGGLFKVVERRFDGEIMHAGRFVELDRPELLVFTLPHGPFAHPDSRVIIEFASFESGCMVELTHVCVNRERASLIEKGWASVLAQLAAKVALRPSVKRTEFAAT